MSLRSVQLVLAGSDVVTVRPACTVRMEDFPVRKLHVIIDTVRTVRKALHGP